MSRRGPAALLTALLFASSALLGGTASIAAASDVRRTDFIYDTQRVPATRTCNYADRGPPGPTATYPISADQDATDRWLHRPPARPETADIAPAYRNAPHARLALRETAASVAEGIHAAATTVDHGHERETGTPIWPTGVAANAGRTGARSCLKSFGGTTLVLMADGSKKPIEDIEVGDEVIATDPETGERVVRKVTRVWIHDDQVLDLVVDGEVITTTEDHLFWSVTDQRFEPADELAAGEVALGDSGRQLTVSGFRRGTERAALAHNLSIARVHTYHVGNFSVLVHNDCYKFGGEAANFSDDELVSMRSVTSAGTIGLAIYGGLTTSLPRT